MSWHVVSSAPPATESRVPARAHHARSVLYSHVIASSMQEAAVPSAAVLALSALALVQGDGLRLEFDEHMQTRIVATGATEEVLGPFTASEILRTDTGELGTFMFEERREDAVHDVLGDGVRVTLTGHAGSIAKIVDVSAYQQRPGWLFLRARFRNDGATAVAVQGYTIARYAFDVPRGAKEPAFWSYQSASYESRPDWVLPVERGYERPNFLGMNAADYGGGTPVLDVWRRDVGLA